MLTTNGAFCTEQIEWSCLNKHCMCFVNGVDILDLRQYIWAGHYPNRHIKSNWYHIKLISFWYHIDTTDIKMTSKWYQFVKLCPLGIKHELNCQQVFQESNIITSLSTTLVLTTMMCKVPQLSRTCSCIFMITVRSVKSK